MFSTNLNIGNTAVRKKCFFGIYIKVNEKVNKILLNNMLKSDKYCCGM